MKWINDPLFEYELFELYDRYCEHTQEYDDILADGWNEELMNIIRLWKR